MNATTRTLTVGLVLVFGTHVVRGDGQYCSDNGGGSPWVCVKWTQGPDPEPVTDFVFDFSDPANPDVQLRTGDGNWRVWSQVSSGYTAADNLGDVTIDATVLSDDFTVKIINDNTGGAGATNVGSLVLDDADPLWAGYSVINGGSITGDLLGGLTVVKDASGGGGTLTFTVGDDLLGDVTIPIVNTFLIGDDSTGTIRIGELAPGGLMRFGPGNLLCPFAAKVSGPVTMNKIGPGASFIIGGELSSNLTVVDKIEGGLLRVDGDVASPSKITIGDMISAGGFDSTAWLAWQIHPTSGPGCLVFAGDLDLPSGIRANQTVHIPSPLTSASSIELNGQDVAGTLFTSRGGLGVISGGGSVTSTGSVLLAAGLEDFLGTATFSSVDSGGEIWVYSGSDLGGTVSVTGDMNGEINLGTIGGSLGASNVLATGRILVGGDCTGDVLIVGDASGDVSITGDATSTSSIHVDESLIGRILIGGSSDADISIGYDTGKVSLIHMEGGFGASGSVTVNTRGSSLGSPASDANGDIRVGPVVSVCCPPPAITYDGCIQVLNGTAGGGDLNGDIDVLGCHATTDDLAICVAGTVNGTVAIAQTSCPNTVTWSCTAPCP